MNDLAILDAPTPDVIGAETRDDLKRTSKSDLARVTAFAAAVVTSNPSSRRYRDKERAGPGSRRVAPPPLSASLCRGSA